MGNSQFIRSIYKSNDQGGTWTSQVLDTTINTLSKIEFVTSDLGYIFGPLGVFYKTEDGGVNWNKNTVTNTINFSDVKFANELLGFVIGFQGDSSYLYSTLNGGDSWQIELIDTGFSAGNLSLTDNYIYCNDYKSIYKRSIESFAVSLRPEISLKKITAFPNPSKDLLFIEIEWQNSNNYCQLLNAQGQIVIETKLNQQLESIDVSHLASGIYTLVVLDSYKALAFSKISIE